MNDDISKEELLAKVEALEAQVHSLEKDLIHDSLTGLKTRAFFEEEARVYLDSILNSKEGQRKQWFGFRNLSLLFLDIDHFKNINDTYGHAVGDAVLKKVAETIQKGLRQGDTASRWGGEEMAVVLLGANESDAVHKAEDIRHSIEALVFTEQPELKVTISSGVASAEAGLSLEALVKRADDSLYNAKETGRNKVVAYSSL
jgi:diguanylate cyclase (GGDEF)-like protein